jgi:hypothetical protein
MLITPNLIRGQDTCVRTAETRSRAGSGSHAKHRFFVFLRHILPPTPSLQHNYLQNTPTSTTTSTTASTKAMLDALDNWCFPATRWYRPTLQQGYTRLEFYPIHGQPLWDDFKCEESELNDLIARLQQHGYVADTFTPANCSSTWSVIGDWIESVLMMAML